MKQTEIDYTVKNGMYTLVGFKNIGSLDDIEEELGSLSHGYFYGRSYYRLTTVGDEKTIRLYNDREFTGVRGHKDLIVGTTYSKGEWEFFVKFLKDAGERFTKIHHAHDVKTIKI